MKLPPPLLLFLLLTAAASAADIPLGSTLYASDPNSKWSSSNNTFTLSFIANPSSAGTLAAAIAYNNISIWQAGPSTNSSAVLRLLTSGDLQLLPSAISTTPLWSSGTVNLNVAAASLEESGRFVLKNSSGATVWSTFDHPTDAIVPNQTFNVAHTLTSGLYSFKLLRNGNLTLLWNNSIVYYNSGLWNLTMSRVWPEMQAAEEMSPRNLNRLKRLLSKLTEYSPGLTSGAISGSTKEATTGRGCLTHLTAISGGRWTAGGGEQVAGWREEHSCRKGR